MEAGQFTSKKILISILLLFIFVGIVLRAYNFTPWLHFELDQARDAKLADLAVAEGPGELQLLGPKAAGTFLRLGPIFYYFQYLGALIFGDTPQGVAYPTLFFGILTIPLAYLFLRRFFNISTSLAIMAVVACSHLLVMYSRFAWNPNAIPFFLLLTFYALLRSVDMREKHRGRWFLIAAASAAVATQLHFLVFLSLPAAMACFLVIKRPKFSWKIWGGSILIILFLYTPVIINDLKTHGANTQEFFKAITKKSEKAGGASHTLADKVIRSYIETANGISLLVTGRESTQMPKIEVSRNIGFISITNRGEGTKDVLLGWLALLALLVTLILFASRLSSERERAKKDMLILVGIWIIICLGLFVPLAFDLSPRFYLLLMPSAFFLLALLIEFMGKLLHSKYVFLIFIIAALCLMNVFYLKDRFDQLSKADKEQIGNVTDRVLKERTRVTLEQQYQIAEYIESIYRTNNQPLYFNSEPEYRRAILYHVAEKGIPYEDLRTTKVYREGNYILLFVTNDSLDKKVSKYVDRYDVIEKKSFGSLTLVRLSPKEEKIEAEKQIVEPKKIERKTYAPGVPVRYTWNEVFEDLGASNVDNADDEEGDNGDGEQ